MRKKNRKTYSNRLTGLKNERFLTHRVLQRISENMHYEIFKYVDWKQLLEIRGINLGGYQLISNRILRSRISNYCPIKFPKIKVLELDKVIEDSRIKLIFEQTGRAELDLEGIANVTKKPIFSQIFRILKLNPEIKELKFGQ